MKAIGYIITGAIYIILFAVIVAKEKKISNYKKSIENAEEVMNFTDSVIDANNTGTLDDPDSTTADYMNLRCKYQYELNF